MTAIIKVDNISKNFKTGLGDVSVLKHISLEIESGDFVIIFGPSGCGKSTLLHTVLGLEEPTSGKVYFLGKNLYERTKFSEDKENNSADEDERSDIRKKYVGMVYQQPNWIKSLTVLENVAFPLLLLGHPKEESIQKASIILTTMMLNEYSGYIPTELSSGQQQRVALARAIVTDPEVIIADEPTGNLDYEAGQSLMALLTDLNKSQNKTILMVTHDLEYLEFAQTTVKMFNGEIVGVYGVGDKRKLLSEIRGKRGI